MGMAVHFNNPELQTKLEQWAVDTGRSADDLVENVMAGYFDELAETRRTLDTRYDDIKSGKVKLIPGTEVRATTLGSRHHAWTPKPARHGSYPKKPHH
jgi:hypothetical protein